jgi:chemotaxis protein MotC
MRALKNMLALSCALAALLTPSRAYSEQTLAHEPQILLRSLQRLQDQIADGDKAALGMQREMATLVDESFRKLERSAYSDEKNAKALIAYGMAGGNPATVEEMIPYIGGRDDELVRLAVAILVFQKGAGRTAESRLKNVDPMRAGGLFGASLALVRGLVTEDDSKARVDFDTARLLAPGTLIEEAALRRLITIHKRRQDPHSFLRISSRYARRFIASPYAAQFAREFISGVTLMDRWIDREEVLEVVEFMPEPYRSAVAVRLMRTATIAGHSELVSNLSALAPNMNEDQKEMPPADRETDIRSELYERISRITSENVSDVAQELRSMDVKTLPEGDQELLRAVLAVAGAVTDPLPATEPDVEPVPARFAAASDTEEGDGTLQGSIFKHPEPEPDPDNMEIDGFIASTRSMLDNVDKVLEVVK